MIRKWVIILFCTVLLCGCTQSSTPLTAEISEIYSKAVETSANMSNYTMIETCHITTTINEEENLNATTKIEIQMDEVDAKRKGYADVEFSIAGVGSNEVEVWEKGNTVYLNNDGAKSMNDVETMDVLSNVINNNFFKIITNTPITSGSKRSEKENTILEFATDEKTIIELLETATVLPEEYTMNVQENGTEITINEQGEVLKIQLWVRADVKSNETTMKIEIDVESVTRSIGNTHVQFPADLSSFDSSKVAIPGGVELLKESLISNFEYIQTDERYAYDWGTEKYIFDFDKMIFHLETQQGQYDYNWATNSGSTVKSGCFYDFETDAQKGCSDEEVENIKLSKEIFESELEYNGISVDSIK